MVQYPGGFLCLNQSFLYKKTKILKKRAAHKKYTHNKRGEVPLLESWPQLLICYFRKLLSIKYQYISDPGFSQVFISGFLRKIILFYIKIK